MNHLKEVSKTDQSNPIDEYFQCLSYCDIHPKGIDNDCEVICMEPKGKTQREKNKKKRA